jgi:hypothetical protein
LQLGYQPNDFAVTPYEFRMPRAFRDKSPEKSLFCEAYPEPPVCFSAGNVNDYISFQEQPGDLPSRNNGMPGCLVQVYNFHVVTIRYRCPPEALGLGNIRSVSWTVG